MESIFFYHWAAKGCVQHVKSLVSSILLGLFALNAFAADPPEFSTWLSSDKWDTINVDNLEYRVLFRYSQTSGYYPSSATLINVLIESGDVTIPDRIKLGNGDAKVSDIKDCFSGKNFGTINILGNPSLYNTFENFKGNVVFHQDPEKVYRDNAFAGMEGKITILNGKSLSKGFYDAISMADPSKLRIECPGKVYEKMCSAFSGNIDVTTNPIWVEQTSREVTSVAFTTKHAPGMTNTFKVFFDGEEITSTDGNYFISNLFPNSKYEILFKDASTGEVLSKDEISTSYFSDIVKTVTFPDDASQGLITVDFTINSELKDYVTEAGVIAEVVSENTHTNQKEKKTKGKIMNDNLNKRIYARTTVRGLLPGSWYKFYPYIVISNKEKVYSDCGREKCTKELKFYVSTAKATQTTFLIKKIGMYGDGTFSPSKIEVLENGETYPIENYKIEDLNPGQSIDLPIRITSADGYTDTYFNNLGQTRSLGLNIESKTGPTSLILKASYDKGDANVTAFTWENSDEPVTEREIVGLEPNTSYSYSVIATIRNKNGVEKKYTASKTFQTSALTLKTMIPTGVSSTSTQAKAETNITEEEPNAGFQWKKFDAPESLAPKEGYGSVYDGKIEGLIKDLSPTSYYNVRAFYKSAKGNYYYGNWITFDPSDFSYLEPTVHTYPINNVTGNTAQLKGYVIAGTDDIIEQGFEYWKNGQTKVRKKMATLELKVSSILSNGQAMRAEITGLEECTEYTCRAFVTTTAGIKYGEEQKFTTEGISGIIDIEDNKVNPLIEGFYDISGQRHPSPIKGLNIIRYSDGSVSKIIIK